MSQKRSVRRYSGLGAAAVALLIVLGFMDPSMMPFASAGTTPPPGVTVPASSVAAGCATHAHYYVLANHFFGPAVTQSSVVDQLAELHNRRCTDPALVVAQSKYEGIGDYPTLNGDSLTIRADQLAANPAAWANAIEVLEANEAGKTASDVTMSGTYQTMYMVAQPTGAPLIRAASLNRTPFMVLRIGSWNFKLNCGFQPVAQSFPGVTQLTPTVSHTPAPHVRTPSTSTPPSNVCAIHPSQCQVVVTVPTTTPRTTTTTCPCTTGNQVQIPVQSQNPGVNVGPTPGAPSAAPTPSPTLAPSRPNTSAPPANSGGYNDGNQNTGGSTCDTTGCSGGGSSTPTGPTGTTDSGDTTSATSVVPPP